MSFSLLGDELNNKIEKNTPLKKQLDANEILEIAAATLEEVFGAKKAIHAKPLFVKNRTLTISCISSAIAQEIRLHHKQLVEEINKKLGKPEIDRIRYLA